MIVSCALQAIDRRERLRRLALETIDLSKDPYFMRNHLGQYECRLCLTLHNNEGNYLAHTQACSRQHIPCLCSIGFPALTSILFTVTCSCQSINGSAAVQLICSALNS